MKKYTPAASRGQPTDVNQMNQEAVEKIEATTKANGANYISG